MHREIVAEQEREEAGRQWPQDQRRQQRRADRHRQQPAPGQPGTERAEPTAWQQAGQGPRQRHDAAEQQAQGATARIAKPSPCRAKARSSQSRRLCHALLAVEHTDMFDSVCQRQPPCRAVREAAIGDAGLSRTRSRHADDPVALVGQHRGLQRPVDDQKIARAVSVTSRENRDTPTVAAIAGCACANCTTMSDAIEWPSRATRPSAAGRAVAWSTTTAEALEQGARPHAVVGEAARQWRRVAPVAREVERDRDIAVAGEGDGEGLHELLGAREPVRDHHHRRWRPAGGREHGDRRRADPGLGDAQRCRGAEQLP